MNKLVLVLIFLIPSSEVFAQVHLFLDEQANTSFEVFGKRKEGQTCPPYMLDSRCGYSAETDATRKANAACHPIDSKQITAWRKLNADEVSANFKCCKVHKYCEIVENNGNPCTGTHGVCTHCYFICE